MPALQTAIDYDTDVVAQYWWLIASSGKTTLIVFFGSVVLSTIFGLALAIMRMSPLAVLRWLSSGFVWLFRGIPALVLLFFTFYALPQLGVSMSPVNAAILGLGLSASAYNAEFFRSGIMSVDKGQWEASRALAISGARTWRRIVLPQAVRIILPPYMSNAITLLKSTSLASVITVSEITGVANRLISSTFRPIEILTVVAALYLAMSTVLTLLQHLAERAVALKE
jgi:His/Glu/Gln/Arg/opine family amino acid ABC transporter permease subunit